MKRAFSGFLHLLALTPILGSAADIAFTADGGYLYSRLEYQSPTSTFSLLSKSGTRGRGQFVLGSGSLDFVAGGGVANFTFSAPATRHLTEKRTRATDYWGGVRYKTAAILSSLTYQSDDVLYLVENSASSFDLRQRAVGFGVLGLTVFGTGAGYRLSIDGQVGIPVGTAKTVAGDLAVTAFTRGVCRVEIGGNFRFGLFAGIENQEYAIERDTKFFRSDFFAGLTLGVGMGSGAGGGSGRSSSGRGGDIPRWPLSP